MPIFKTCVFTKMQNAMHHGKYEKIGKGLSPNSILEIFYKSLATLDFVESLA